MAYIGQRPTTGENESFKVLDDISSYTLSFNGSSSSVVSAVNDTIYYQNHRFINGQKVTYSNGGGTDIGGLTNGSTYYIIKNDNNTIKLASTHSDAIAGIGRNISGVGTGGAHTINVAFDGFNTKFKATYNDGTIARLHRAAQLTISFNGVIQQPNDTSSPSTGYGIDFDSVIVFSQAPTSTDIFWGNLLANNLPTYDITDNKVDNFTGDGSTVDFNLSKSPLSNDNVLVTIDGVTQYPSDNQNTRAYNVVETTLTFSSAPPAGSSIQVRHIGFAGSTGGSGGVTGFYGRTGNVSLRDTDNVVVQRMDATEIGITSTATAGLFSGPSEVGIQSTGTQVGVGVTQLNFIGVGNTFKFNSGTKTVDIAIQGGGGGGAFSTSVTGVQTSSPIAGIGTTSTDDSDLQGIGNSARGLYIANGMIIHDNLLSGNHYIGTNFSGLMAGPVNITGVLSVDGSYVVV